MQVEVLSVDKDCVEHAKEVNNELQDRGIRAELDSSAATIGYKIRDSELRKIPYMAIVGKREIKSGKIAVRKHRTGNVGSFTIEELIWNLKADQ